MFEAKLTGILPVSLCYSFWPSKSLEQTNEKLRWVNRLANNMKPIKPCLFIDSVLRYQSEMRWATAYFAINFAISFQWNLFMTKTPQSAWNWIIEWWQLTHLNAFETRFSRQSCFCRWNFVIITLKLKTSRNRISKEIANDSHSKFGDFLASQIEHTQWSWDYLKSTLSKRLLNWKREWIPGLSQFIKWII